MLEDLEADSSLCDKFCDIKCIAGGGFCSTVYSAIDKSIPYGHERRVALKKLSLTGKGHCRAALREVLLLKKLNHDNVVRTYKIVDSTGSEVDDLLLENEGDLDNIFIVEELFDTDLHQLLERNGNLTYSTIKLFMYQLLRGLKYIHSSNVLHRDIKPGNLLINVQDLTLKIGDFGLARIFDEAYCHKGYMTSVVSTRYYRAPEIMTEVGNYSTPIDIWSCGCVLAEMLNGRVLFNGDNDLEQLKTIYSAYGLDEVRVGESGSFPEHLFDKSTPAKAVDLLRKLLTLDPSARLSATEALAHPFFTSLHDADDEPVNPDPLFVEDEVDNLPIHQLKRKILRHSSLIAQHDHAAPAFYSSDENLFYGFDATFETSAAVRISCSKSKSCGKSSGYGTDPDRVSPLSSQTSELSYVEHDSLTRHPARHFAATAREAGVSDEPCLDPASVAELGEEVAGNDDGFLNSDFIVSHVTSSVLDESDSYFSEFSPVIDAVDDVELAVNDLDPSFLGLPGHSSVDYNWIDATPATPLQDCVIVKEDMSVNDEIIHRLNQHADELTLHDLASNKFADATFMSKASMRHMDSLRFLI